MEIEACAVAILVHLLLFLQETVQVRGIQRTVVSTENGKVRGTRHEVNGKKVDIYWGIPYAQPPVGKMRFRPPVQVDPWYNIKDALKKPNSCMQGYDNTFGNFSGSQMWNPNTKTDEDCLYLNVWVPSDSRSNSNKAVMVWIYGGSFYSGSSALDVYEGRYLATENDVIVVSMQYRVGSLGFLTLGHFEAPGNVGLLDQRMALEWIQRNIRFFGGSSRNVTLFGESSGAVSIGLHMLSPTSRGLFQRAIFQSGAPQTDWGTLPMSEAQRRTHIFAGMFGCDEMPPGAIIECLRKIPAEEIYKKELFGVVSGIIQFPFVPVVDGTFLVESPAESLKNGRFKKMPILVGSNANEGSYFLVYHEPKHFNHTKETLISQNQFKLIMDDLFSFYPRHPKKLNPFGKEAIMFQYTHWLDPSNQTMIRSNIDQAVSDFFFVCHVNNLAKTYAKDGHNVYYYLFTHRSSVNPWGKWMGVLHADEINFVFGEPLIPSKGYTQSEIELSRKMMRFWSNFAKTGDPNRGPGEISLGDWPLYKPHEQLYLNLNTDFLHQANKDLAIGVGPRLEQCAFWHEYLPELVAGTADITEVEKDWKLSFHEWKTRYIVDWKNQFDNFLQNYERRLQTCGVP